MAPRRVGLGARPDPIACQGEGPVALDHKRNAKTETPVHRMDLHRRRLGKPRAVHRTARDRCLDYPTSGDESKEAGMAAPSLARREPRPERASKGGRLGRQVGHGLDQVRSRGFATNEGESDLGVFGLAAPIFDSREVVIGSVNLTIPAYRHEPSNRDRDVTAVVETARRISRTMGASAVR